MPCAARAAPATAPTSRHSTSRRSSRTAARSWCRCAAPRRPAPSGPAEGVPLNLNTATTEQLDELDGIGPGMAAAILEYREQHSGFGSVDELGQVPGIGEKRLAALRERVRV